jgi:hypothetical protein
MLPVISHTRLNTHETMASSVNQPFPDEDDIHTRKVGGTFCDYLTADVVAKNMNDNFKWSNRVVNITKFGDEVVCHMEVTVFHDDGTVTIHQDVGTGTGTEAYKSAVSDALKRTCRLFGFRFGLCLKNRASIKAKRAARNRAQAQKKRKRMNTVIPHDPPLSPDLFF